MLFSRLLLELSLGMILSSGAAAGQEVPQPPIPPPAQNGVGPAVLARAAASDQANDAPKISVSLIEDTSYGARVQLKSPDGLIRAQADVERIRLVFEVKIGPKRGGAMVKLPIPYDCSLYKIYAEHAKDAPEKVVAELHKYQPTIWAVAMPVVHYSEVHHGKHSHAKSWSGWRLVYHICIPQIPTLVATLEVPKWEVDLYATMYRRIANREWGYGGGHDCGHGCKYGCGHGCSHGCKHGCGGGCSECGWSFVVAELFGDPCEKCGPCPCRCVCGHKVEPQAPESGLGPPEPSEPSPPTPAQPDPAAPQPDPAAPQPSPPPGL